MLPTPTREAAAGSDQFVRDRVTQISELLQLIDNEKLIPGEVTHNPRTLLQRLPRHMRRRAMNKNFRRFPRRLHHMAKIYITTKGQKKPPSRFARRRTHFRLMEYFRRQRKIFWLDTHVWHAKRFRMEDRWGYKLPIKSFQHSFRPIYRSSLRTCCIRDMSYLTCLKISGPSQDYILKKMQQFTLPYSGSTLSHNKDGLHELSILLYEPELRPHGFIGPARVSWNTNGERHSLIIWVHPSIYEKVLRLLKALFELEPEIEQSLSPESPPEPKNKKELKQHLKKPSRNIVHYNGAADIQVEDFRNQLVRFRIFGPKSLPTIQNVFKIIKTTPKNFLLRASKNEQFQDGALYSVISEDVRLKMYAKKNSVDDDSDGLLRAKTKVIPSLFNNEVRIAAVKKRLPTCEFDKHRKNLIFQNGATELENKIPIQIIIRNKGLGHATALDGAEIVAPSVFGMDIWMAFQYHACAASSLQDHSTAHLESSSFVFPNDVPDCDAGVKEAQRKENELWERELRRPYSKRIPYWLRFSIRFPFAFEWNLLVNNWGGEDVESLTNLDAFVLRNRHYLNEIRDCFTGRKTIDSTFKDKSALIPVKIKMYNRGRPKRYAIICIPKGEDLKLIDSTRREIEEPSRYKKSLEEGMDDESDHASTSDDPFCGFISLEPVAPTVRLSLAEMFPVNPLIDRAEKRKHLNKKKRLAVKRRKVEVEKRAAQAQREADEQFAAGYKNSTTREICGRIVRGGFSFAESKGFALGYIPLAALASIPSYKNKRIVLVRNTMSRFYNFGIVSILDTKTEI